MYFTGGNYNRYLPEVNGLKLLFSGISFDGATGQTEIGISGTGQGLRFKFISGKVYSPESKIVGSYNSGEKIDLNWIIDTGTYQYKINDSFVENRKSKNNFNVQKFFINSTCTNFTVDAKIFTPDISYSVNFPENFQALNSLTGTLTNSSIYGFKIFESNLEILQTDEELLSGVNTGFVSGQNNFNIVFSDRNTSRFNNEVNFVLSLQTAIGEYRNTFSTNRVSGLDIVSQNVYTDTSGASLPILFDGSGNIGNVFTFASTSGSYLVSYYCPATNLRGETKNKIITIQIEPSYPGYTGVYTGSYVTGFSLTSSGEYLYPPMAKFTGYYYVSNLTTTLNSVLLSSGCSGNVPVTFSGNNSRGLSGSGILRSSKVILSGMYGEGRNTYYLPQTFEILNTGTGYISQPNAFLQTGIFSNCFDVGGKYGTTYSIFKPFSGVGLLGSQADYLTGEVLTTTGLVSGGQLTGYLITGIEFTNLGSGYTSGNFRPLVSFERANGDTLTKNATGTFTMKSTGQYLFNNLWTISTGLSNSDLVILSGTGGIIYLNSGNNYLNLNVNFSGLDNTQPVVCKITTSMVGGDSIIHYFSGVKYYDTSTGFLKKKNNLELTTFEVGSDLSFNLTESDLDTYYSSSEWLNSGTEISLGSLEF